MESSSNKIKKVYDMLVHGVDCKVPIFKLSSKIVEALEPAKEKSQIPPKVLLFHDICSFYYYSIHKLGKQEMNEAYNKLCVDGSLKPKHK